MSTNTGTAPAAAVEHQRNVWAAYRDLPRSERLRVNAFAGYLALLTLLFIRPLAELVSYAAVDNLHSYVVLAPFITAYLLYLGRGRRVSYRSSMAGALLAGAAGITAVVGSFHWSAELSRNDGLAVMTLAVVSFVVAGGFLLLGAEWMAGNAFPFAFLLFLIPPPDAAVNWLENALMLATADAAALNFRIWGVAVVRTGTTFELPGITLQVARECSGINSTWALLITSVLTSHLFLSSRWRRLVLVAFVIPLGILRNGFRILVIGWLCVNVGPEMIDSPIHHRGGPIFFALSLVPFFLLLWWLRRQEQASSEHPPRIG